MSTSSATERDVAGLDTSPPTAEPDGGAPPVPVPPRRFRFRLGVAGWTVDRWFLLIAIPIGVFFVLAIPPTQGIDESAHFIRAWLVSGGDVVARTEIDGNTGVRHAGGDIDACVIDYVSKFQIRAAEPDDFEPHDYWFDTPPCSPQERGWVIADAASNYTPLSYAPQVVVLSATRAVGLPVPVSFFGGRLAGLAAFIAVVWWAIRLAPGGKSVLMVVALLPTTLMSAATYNADGVADALAILAVALTASIALSSELNRRHLALLTGALVVLGMIKQPYLVFALLPFLIPNGLFGRTSVAVVSKVAIGALVGVASLAWLAVGTPEVEPEVFRAGVDHGAQLKFIVQHPFDFLATVARTIAAAGPQSYTLRGIVGSFGMGRYVGRANDVVAPIISVVFATALLAVAFGRDAGERLEDQSPARRIVASVGPLVVTIAGILAVYASMYLIWAPVGADYVTDVQGRYFIPVLAVPVLSLVLRRRPVLPRPSEVWLAGGSTLLLLFAIGKSFLVFY